MRRAVIVAIIALVGIGAAVLAVALRQEVDVPGTLADRDRGLPSWADWTLADMLDAGMKASGVPSPASVGDAASWPASRHAGHRVA